MDGGGSKRDSGDGASVLAASVAAAPAVHLSLSLFFVVACRRISSDSVSPVTDLACGHAPSCRGSSPLSNLAGRENEGEAEGRDRRRRRTGMDGD